MPRKRKLIKKDEGKITQGKPLLTQEEKNSLEQALDIDEDKIDISELKEFLKESKIENLQAPVLKKINPPQKNPVKLETTFADEPPLRNQRNQQKEEDEENGFKYAFGNRENEESKYNKYDYTGINQITSISEIEKIRRNTPFEKREIKFESSYPEQEKEGKYIPVIKADKEKLGKERPFERKEIKYTPEKY